MTKLQSGRRQKLILASSAVCFASALALSGCTISAPEAGPTSSGDLAVKSDLLANHGLEGLGAAEVIERLDTMPVSNRPAGLQASVQPDAVVLSDTQQREARLPLPEDGMYVSIAPYKSQTHDCYFHSLTTCVGELGNTDVQVRLTSGSGEVLVDEVRKTYDNGFLGLWVPRDIHATLRISHAGQIGTASISTKNEDDPTCITNLRLA